MMRKAAAGEQCGNQLGGPVHERDDGGDFFAGHDHRDIDLLVGAHGIDAVLQSMAQDALVEEDQGIHGLVLGGGRDVAMHRQVGEERFDLGFGGEEVLARPHAVEPDEPDDPLHIGSLGMNGVVVPTEHLSHVIEEFGWLIFRLVRHIRSPSWRPESADNSASGKTAREPA